MQTTKKFVSKSKGEMPKKKSEVKAYFTEALDFIQKHQSKDTIICLPKFCRRQKRWQRINRRKDAENSTNEGV